MAAKAPITRLLVSADIPPEIDAVRVDLVVMTRKQDTKTAVNDAVIRVGLQHLDEVAALLTSTPESGDPS
jgi:hypothetical protein